jgi:AcrR family transcriptional regulator
MSESTPQPSSLRAQQVAQTRDSLVGAGRELFGQKGFRQTSVEDLARAARVTTGALHHHFPTQTALFVPHLDLPQTALIALSLAAAQEATDDLDVLARGFEAFLDAVLEPEFQRILILDGPAVLGPARYTELDERYAFAVIVAGLRAATEAGSLHVDDPEIVTRLLLGALTRGAMLIANSPDPVGTRHAVALSMRTLLSGFIAPDRS